MALSISRTIETKKKSVGLTINDIQKMIGIWSVVGFTGGGSIVNILGNKGSCFYTDGCKIESVKWSVWKDVKFEPAKVEITLSNKDD